MTAASHLPANPAPVEPPAPQRVSALRVVTQVLPGGRIELTAPELPEGGTVEVVVILPRPAAPAPAPAEAAGTVPAARPGEHVLDILASLPPGPRSGRTWEEVERHWQEERDAWDRER